MFLAQADVIGGGNVIQYGVAGAVIAVVMLFLKYLEKRDKDLKIQQEADQKARAEEREQERQDRRIERESSIAAYNKIADTVTQLSGHIQHCPIRNYDPLVGERKGELL